MKLLWHNVIHCGSMYFIAICKANVRVEKSFISLQLCHIPSVRLRSHLTILVQLMSSADQQYTDLTSNCSCVPRQYGELLHQHREGVPEWMEWYVHYGQLTKRQLVVPMVKDRIPCGIGRSEQLRHSDRLCFVIDTEILSLGLVRAVKCPAKVKANGMVEWHVVIV